MTEPTLDDLALYVLQLEPEDREDLARLREQLAALALGGRVPVPAQPFVAGAMRALAPLAEGTAADPYAAIGAVGRLLQRALADALADGPDRVAGRRSRRAPSPSHCSR